MAEISTNENGKVIATFNSMNVSESIYISAYDEWSGILDGSYHMRPIDNFIVTASKGNDVLKFVSLDYVEDITSFKQGVVNGKPTRDLIITYRTSRDSNGNLIEDVSERPERKVTLQNYFKTTKADSTSLSYSIELDIKYDNKGNQIPGKKYKLTDLCTHEIMNPSKNTVGTIFADVVDSSANNETFTLKQGHNTINFDAKAGFGNDTVVLTKGETLNLNIDIENPENIQYTKSGNDLLITVTSNSEDEGDIKGTIRVKNYAKTSSGATLKINDKVFDEEITIVGTGKKQDSFVGSRLNDVATSTEKKETFNLGTGKDKIIFSSDDIGDDTIVLGKGEELTLEGLSTDSDLSFTRSGNNITITDSNKTGSITIKDYLKNMATVKIGESNDDRDNDLASVISNNSNSQFLTYKNLNPNKAVKWTGTILDETFYGSAKNDVIKAVGGKNYIEGGKGNDKLYGGTGENEFVFHVGDGNDTVYLTKGSENTFATHRNLDTYSIDRYSIKGNDVIITNIKDPIYDNQVLVGKTIYDIDGLDGLAKKPKKGKYTLINGKYYSNSDLEGRSQSTIVDTITVKDYLKGGYDVFMEGRSVDLKDLLNSVDELVDARRHGIKGYNKSQTLKGNILNEFFYGGNKADKIYTGAGTDTVNAGKGNDTIYLNGAGEKTLNFEKGDGNDVVYMNYDGVKANLVFKANGEDSAEETDVQPEFSFSRTGNDLIINRKYTEASTSNEISKVTSDNVTVKNYFNNPTDSALKINDAEFSPDFIKENRLSSIKYNTTSSKKLNLDLQDYKFKDYSWFDPWGSNFNWEINGSKYNDYIATGSGDDSVYETGGNDNYILLGEGNNYVSFTNAGGFIQGGAGDDTYSITGMNKTVVISDYGGNDTLELWNTTADKGTDLMFFFNVGSDGKICEAQPGDDDYMGSRALAICNKNNIDRIKSGKDFTGYVWIHDYFGSETYNTEFTGDGLAVEKISYVKNIDNITQIISENGDNKFIHYNITDDIVNQVCQDVANWLNTKDGKYGDALDVFDYGSKDDIQALIAIYQKADYQVQNNQ